MFSFLTAYFTFMAFIFESILVFISSSRLLSLSILSNCSRTWLSVLKVCICFTITLLVLMVGLYLSSSLCGMIGNNWEGFRILTELYLLLLSFLIWVYRGASAGSILSIPLKREIYFALFYSSWPNDYPDSSDSSDFSDSSDSV